MQNSVSTWQPAHLENEKVKLLPVATDDFEDLYAEAADPLIWEQHPVSNRHEKEVFREYFEGALKTGSAFIIKDKSSGRIIGSTRYYDHNDAGNRVAIGFTFLSRQYWGGQFNRSVKNLMLEYAFRYVNEVVFHVGAGNARSQAALSKIGAARTREFYNDPGNDQSLSYEYTLRKEEWKRRSLMNDEYCIVDLHCDLLSYLQEAPAPDPTARESIGCSLPNLEDGNVAMQVMAIYSATVKGSTKIAQEQVALFEDLLKRYSDRAFLFCNNNPVAAYPQKGKLGAMAAIENASCFCEEDEPLQAGFNRLEDIITATGRILYIGLTHADENRFGGGNASKAGLKEDGRALLNYINGRKIAVDFSHTSDALAYDMINHIDKFSLDIPVIASHSNFRTIWNHPRNLPDEIAQQIINRKGLIGINFLRAFLNNLDPAAIYDHILYGIELGGASALCFGADFFYTASHPDQSRAPFFHKEHDSAGCYPAILANLAARISPNIVASIANRNAYAFISRLGM